jgi:hypothetical protein
LLLLLSSEYELWQLKPCGHQGGISTSECVCGCVGVCQTIRAVRHLSLSLCVSVMSEYICHCQPYDVMELQWQETTCWSLLGTLLAVAERYIHLCFLPHSIFWYLICVPATNWWLVW